MLKSFGELKAKVLAAGQKKVIALASAADEASLEAIRDAQQALGVECLFIGDNDSIIAMAEKVGLDIKSDNIIHTNSHQQAAELAVGLVRDGKADVLMKGQLPTGTLLKAVVDKDRGIRTGGLMSHVAVLESPSYHKLMFITDGGMVTGPNLEQKQAILDNCVTFAAGLGYNMPKVAVLAAVETVNDKMPETVDAGRLAEMNRAGEIGGGIIEGPLSFDLAISAESAKIKGFTSQVAGDSDIFLAPDIATGNILSKALIYLGGAKMAGCVLGAAAPIILVSRGASAEEKMLSILLAMAV
ncbi:MAG: bifunctional enoyl-CoA hydratase/phosphate acetyltransferase [Defluviitaleaceae bacterium]|nr:bifunctional enoyl-CoA hydratase/phosphate acetyltransferase [Defluviitaleaceae bacterium]